MKMHLYLFIAVVAILFEINVHAQRGGNSATIVRAGYDFAPSIMRDVDGTYKMWWCSGNLEANPQQVDYIRYSTAPTMAGPWSTPQVVFQPSYVSGKFDEDSVCSPSVVKVNGTYYMFYEAADFYFSGGQMYAAGGTKIGVASSANGLNWTRLNSGNPIAFSYNYPNGNSLQYGAGYPSVSYVDGYFYLFYFDSTGYDQSKRGYILRSTSPIFTPPQTEQLGATTFIPYNASTRTHYGVRDVVNGDLAYHHGLGEFMIGITGIANQIHTAFFNKNFKTELRLDYVTGQWTQGPGYFRDPHGNHPKYLPDIGFHYSGNLYQNSCYTPIDFMRSVSGDPLSNLGDLGYIGYNYIISKRCGDMTKRYRQDFDGDYIADQAVYRPSNNIHYRNNTTTGIAQSALSQPNAVPIKGDFDGDDKSDFGIVYPSGGYLWWVIIQSSNGAVRTQPTWGYSTDKIAIADYNGDGKDDFATYRDGEWWIILDNGLGYSYNWGLPSDIPVAADYDGDGIDELAVYRPSEGIWYIRDQYTNVTRSQLWGLPGDIPIPADFIADGKDDFAVWRPSNGTWYLLDNAGVVSETTQWGLTNDIPIAEDFNGDGVVELTVWRNSNGYWYHNYRNGRTSTNQFGLPNDLIHRIR